MESTKTFVALRSKSSRYFFVVFLALTHAVGTYAQVPVRDKAGDSPIAFELQQLSIKDFGQSRPLQEASRFASISLCCSASLKDRDVIGISWEGPYDGYVLLLDSSKRVVDRSKTGFIRSMASISIDGRGDLLLVDMTEGSGTGYRKDKYVVIDTQDGTLRKVWEGLSLERSFPLQGAPDQNFERVGFVRIAQSEEGQALLEHVVQTTTFRVTNSKLSPRSVKRSSRQYVFRAGSFVSVK